MSRPIVEATPLRKVAGNEWGTQQLSRRYYPSQWRYVGSGDIDPRTDTYDPYFEEANDNAGGGMQDLRFRDSGFNTVDIEGVIATPMSIPTLVAVIPNAYPLPELSVVIPGTSAHDWQLDPDGSLSVIS